VTSYFHLKYAKLYVSHIYDVWLFVGIV